MKKKLIKDFTMNKRFYCQLKTQTFSKIRKDGLKRVYFLNLAKITAPRMVTIVSLVSLASVNEIFGYSKQWLSRTFKKIDSIFINGERYCSPEDISSRINELWSKDINYNTLVLAEDLKELLRTIRIESSGNLQQLKDHGVFTELKKLKTHALISDGTNKEVDDLVNAYFKYKEDELIKYKKLLHTYLNAISFDKTCQKSAFKNMIEEAKSFNATQSTVVAYNDNIETEPESEKG